MNVAGERYRALRTLQVTQLDPPGDSVLPAGALFRAWAEREDRVEISLGEHVNRFGSTARTHLVPLASFSEACEAGPLAIPDGDDECNAIGHTVRGGPHVLLTGLREDIDAGLKNRRGEWDLDLEELTLLCEVLATGQTRKLERTDQYRVWKLEWTLEDPRSEFERVETSLADQLLWCFPGGEDWTVFRMSCTDLVHGLGRELPWLMQLPEQPFRAQLSVLLVLLDQAAIRCGI